MAADPHSTLGWSVYIIRTEGGRLYTGITTDVLRRFRDHCEGKTGAKFFRTDKPATLALVENGLTRSSASQREAAIKKLSPGEKRQLIRCQGPVELCGQLQATIQPNSASD
ncbi:MAG: GIY-YIG nuclease family protein [Cellvibrionaceae bacterium]